MTPRQQLNQLEIGDRFIPANSRHPKFEVIGKPKFNIKHGSPTRDCLNESTQQIESKSCRLSVIKL